MEKGRVPQPRVRHGAWHPWAFDCNRSTGVLCVSIVLEFEYLRPKLCARRRFKCDPLAPSARHHLAVPPKKKGEEVKEKPILGRFKSNLKVRGLIIGGKGELGQLPGRSSQEVSLPESCHWPGSHNLNVLLSTCLPGWHRGSAQCRQVDPFQHPHQDGHPSGELSVLHHRSQLGMGLRCCCCCV